MKEVSSLRVLQLTDEQLYDIVVQIRQIASLGWDGFRVLRDNKTENWKNALLNELSDDVVYNHLKYLHPFQFFKCNFGAAVYEFRVCFYKNNIYLKVNLKTKEVLSFHFDEDPDMTSGFTSLSQSVEDTPSLPVIVEDSARGRGKPIAQFAIGSHIVNVPVDVAYSASGLPYLENTDYLDLIESMGTGIQKRVLKAIEDFDAQGLQELLGSTKNYQILSMVHGQLGLVSLCFDICDNYMSSDKNISMAMANQAIDILFRQPEADIKKFLATCHPSQFVRLPSKETILGLKNQLSDEGFVSESKDATELTESLSDETLGNTKFFT